MIPHRLVCTLTGESYPHDTPLYLSPAAEAATPPGGCLAGVLEVQYLWDELPRPLARTDFDAGEGTARWAPMLPIASASLLPPLSVGDTPLVGAGRWGRARGFAHLWFKDDTRNPTGSYKDRASTLVVAKARERGAHRIAAASTGNAATALAGMCASAGLEAVVFVPAGAPQGKLAQLLAYGARVVRVAGTYDDAFELSLAATRAFGWYNRNTAYNPFTIDGKRTAAFEIARQLAWNVPDVVAVGVGDGVILSGLAKGFRDLRDAGLIDRVPRLLACQAAGSDSIVRGWCDGLTTPPTVAGASSMADSIVVEAPRNGVMALRDLRATGGAAIGVTEEEIRAALVSVASETGIYIEASCAAAAAGVVKAADQGLISRDETIVCVLTGTGLKDAAGTLKCVALPEPIAPKLENLPADLLA